MQADQDWKYGGLNKNKYIIRKPCPCVGNCEEDGQCLACGGTGEIQCSPKAQYFVLRLDCEDGVPCDPNARFALASYATSVAAENPQFALDLFKWLQATAPTTSNVNCEGLEKPGE
jgi:hypothetical protein